MLELTIPEKEWWDEVQEQFCHDPAVTLRLEHSLISLSKWESKWNVPFYADEPAKTPEMMTDYIRCMTVTQGVDPAVYSRLTRENLNAIYTYMNDPMTATWFAGEPKPGAQKQNLQNGVRKPPLRQPGRKVITAEVVYSQMFLLHIPMECEKWHLNRLFTLIRVCSEARTPPKKMSRNDMLDRRRALNAKRLRECGGRT